MTTRPRHARHIRTVRTVLGDLVPAITITALLTVWTLIWAAPLGGAW